MYKVVQELYIVDHFFPIEYLNQQDLTLLQLYLSFADLSLMHCEISLSCKYTRNIDRLAK